MPSGHVSIAVAFLMLSPAIVKADKLSITSNPPGATVEIDGAKVGTTPFVKDYPDTYFHRSFWALKSRLEHPLVARITLEGFAPKELVLCDGPMQWKDRYGRDRGAYWTFKVSNFDVTLTPIPKAFTGEVTVKTARNLTVELGRDLTLEEIVAEVKPSVVYLEGLERAGTGFFVTSTGLIATNAHVARGEESLTAKVSAGFQLVATVVYIDDEVDIALLKVEGNNFSHLDLAEASTVRQGQEVFAVGNPGEAMAFSVTKGIVSGVDKFPNAGPGTWIQTDAQLNPGNSGGPLVNMKGEVVGITTSKSSGPNTTGIGFALSASDLVRILNKFYPKQNQLATPRIPDVLPPAPLPTEPPSARAPNGSTSPLVPYGIVHIQGPVGSRIELDKVIVGDVPGLFKLSPGVHKIVVILPGGFRQAQFVHVVANSEVTVEPPPMIQPSQQ
jgi:serine protease Do